MDAKHPTIAEPSETHKRALLRGREAEAQSLIKSGVFAARMYATYLGLSTLLSIVAGPNWRVAGILAFWTATILLSAKRVEQGNRIEAIILFIILFLGFLVSLAGGGIPWVFQLLIAVATLVPIGRAIGGTFALARIRQDAGIVPGATQLLTDDTD
jgi:hypothetical protein